MTVLASRRAYDNPETVLPKHETWRGIRIIRIGSTGFGKGAKWRRISDFASFLALCSWRLLFLPRFDAVVALTSPPLVSFLATWVARLRGSRFYYWVMDFNPDEAIAAGWLRVGSLAARLLEKMSRFSLRHANKIIALDRYMRDRIVAKGISPHRIAILVPWAHDNHVEFDPKGRYQFRQAHGLQDKFVVMYSGNHSPVHPLDTLLEAAKVLEKEEEGERREQKGESSVIERQALALEERKNRNAESGGEVRNTEPPFTTLPSSQPNTLPAVVFLFVGGGSEWCKVKESAGQNVVCLPYQPLEALSGSLSAADLHGVVMGNDMVGLVHPCKIYNILSVGAPVLYIGPTPSHISEIVAELNGTYLARAAGHGEVGKVVDVVKEVRKQKAESRNAGEWRVPEIHARFSRNAVLPRMLDILEGKS